MIPIRNKSTSEADRGVPYRSVGYGGEIQPSNRRTVAGRSGLFVEEPVGAPNKDGIIVISETIRPLSPVAMHHESFPIWHEYYYGVQLDPECAPLMVSNKRLWTRISKKPFPQCHSITELDQFDSDRLLCQSRCTQLWY